MIKANGESEETHKAAEDEEWICLGERVSGVLDGEECLIASIYLLKGRMMGDHDQRDR